MQNQMENVDLKAYIIDHLIKVNKDFEQELITINVHLELLKLIKENINFILTINQTYPRNELETLKLGGLFNKIDVKWKQLIAINLFVKYKMPQELKLIFEKRTLWVFLLDSSKINRLCQWLASHLEDKELYVKLDSEFEITLNELFNNWDIEYDMLEMIDNYPELHKYDTLLNFIAKHSYFILEERQNVLKYMRRVALSQTFDQNKSHIFSEHILEQIFLKCFEDQNFYTMFDILNNFPEIKSYKFVQDLIETNTEFKLLTISHNDDFNLRDASQEISKYLATYENQSKDKTLFIKMFENSTHFHQTLSKYQHFLNFLEIYESGYAFTKQSQHSILENFLLKQYDINLNEILNARDIFKDRFMDDNMSKNCIKLSLPQNLQQSRASYALFNNFIEQLKTYSKITKENLKFVAQSAIDVALQNYSNNEIVSHCISIIEMIGYDASNLRSIINISKMIPGNISETMILKEINFGLDNSIHESNNKYFSVEIFKKLFTIIKFCDIYSYQYPTNYLKQFAENNQWRQMLLFCQVLNYPTDVVINFAKNNMTHSSLSKNMFAIGHSNSAGKSNKQKRFDLLKRSSSSSLETTVKSFHEECDLFYILLTSLNWYKINEKSEQYNWPVLAVLSASFYQTDVLEAWKYWLCNTVSYMKSSEYIEKQTTEFDLIQYCVKNGFLKTLSESFQIFYLVSFNLLIY